jgi:hypothetical protein
MCKSRILPTLAARGQPIRMVASPLIIRKELLAKECGSEGSEGRKGYQRRKRQDPENTGYCISAKLTYQYLVVCWGQAGYSMLESLS